MGNIPEEVLLALAVKGGGGGGGGTSNYEDLENKPKINGETLSGNKSASDLGLASDDTVQGILDGQSIDSFSDVETALAGKADTATVNAILDGQSIDSFADVETALEGKQNTLTFDSVPTDGSTNPVESNGVYDALALKANASDVTTAIATKQDAFTSGDYLEMANGVLNVTKNKGNDLYSYKFITTSTSDQPRVKIQRYINGVFQSEQIYNNDNVRVNPVTLDGLFTFTYGVDGYRWQYTLLANSHQHNVGDVVKWLYNVSVDSTESFDVIPQDTSKDLVLQEDLDAALATKADIADLAPAFSTTTAYAVGQYVSYDGNIYKCTTAHSAGAWVAGDFTLVAIGNELNEVNSNLTNLQDWTDADTKTVTGNPITLTDAAAVNAKGLSMTVEPIQDLHGYDKPWVGGAGKNKLYIPTYNNTVSGVTVTVDSNGVVSVNGTLGIANNGFIVQNSFAMKSGSYILNGGNDDGAVLYLTDTSDNLLAYTRNADAPFTLENDMNVRLYIFAYENHGLYDEKLYPMIRLSTETDATFAPYTNICPISGLTEGSVQRDGNDVWTGNDTYTSASAGYVIPSTTISLPIGMYAFEFDCSNPNGLMQFEVFKNNSQQGADRIYNSDGFNVSTHNRVKFTINEAGTNLRLYSNNSSGASISNVRLYSTIDTATITFGQTVYGGSVDFKTGKVRVTKAVVDLGDFTWSDGSSNGATRSTSEISGAVNPTSNYNKANMTSERYVVLPYYVDGVSGHDANSTNGALGIEATNSNKIFIRDANFANMSGADIKTALTGSKLLYELATPTELTLTPAQLELLKGYNTITSNGATITMTYQPDNLVGEVMEQVDEKIAVVDGEKQDKTDTNLNTTAKTVIGAINEVDGKISNLLTRRNMTNTTQANGAFLIQTSGEYIIPIGFKVVEFPEGYGEVGGYIIRGVDGNYYIMLRDANGTPIANKQYTIQVVFVAQVNFS